MKTNHAIVRAALAGMDRDLRDEGHTLNPGTTADLTAAAVFLELLETTVRAGTEL